VSANWSDTCLQFTAPRMNPLRVFLMGNPKKNHHRFRTEPVCDIQKTASIYAFKDQMLFHASRWEQTGFRIRSSSDQSWLVTTKGSESGQHSLKRETHFLGGFQSGTLWAKTAPRIRFQSKDRGATSLTFLRRYHKFILNASSCTADYKDT